MGETVIFKTAAVGGFDKKSVLSYIDTLNEKFHATEAEYFVKFDEYSKAQESQLAYITKLEARLAEMEGKLTAVAEQLEKEREIARQAQTVLSELDEQNKALEKQVSDKEREIQIQLERGRQLQFKAESLDFKSKKYDEMSIQIGEALLEARHSADSIVADAKAKSAEITNQAGAYMRSFHTELGSFKGDAARLRKSVEEILFVLNDRVDVMQEVVRDIETRFNPESVFSYAEERPFVTVEDQAGYFGQSDDETE